MTTSIAALAGASAVRPLNQLQSLSSTPKLSEKDAMVKEKFQDFTAGTFYKQMLKAMRDTQQKPAYFHGGQAEEVFQSQMDDIVTNNLAKSHGASLSDSLFKVYQQQRHAAGAKLDAQA